MLSCIICAHTRSISHIILGTRWHPVDQAIIGLSCALHLMMLIEVFCWVDQIQQTLNILWHKSMATREGYKRIHLICVKSEKNELWDINVHACCQSYNSLYDTFIELSFHTCQKWIWPVWCRNTTYSIIFRQSIYVVMCSFEMVQNDPSSNLWSYYCHSCQAPVQCCICALYSDWSSDFTLKFVAYSETLSPSDSSKQKQASHL